MPHFINKCTCGTIISQCRCFTQDKRVQVISDGCHKCADEKKMALLEKQMRAEEIFNVSAR